MPPKRKTLAKAPTKPRTVTPKEKPANMSQEEWEDEKRRCSFATADRKRRRITALEAAKAVAAAEVCLSLGGGQPEGSQQPAGRNFLSSPSSPGYYARYYREGSSLSQMRLSQMDGRARYSPECADSDMTFDPNAPFSPDSAPRGSSAFRLGVDLNSSPDLRRPGSTDGHVTDSIGLPRHLFADESRSAHQVFGSTSGVSMGEDEITGGADILTGFIRHGHAYEPPVDEYEEEADKDEGEEEEEEVQEEPLARAWHEMYRERIGQEVLAARAASTFMSPPAPSTFMSAPASSTFMPPPATVDPVAATELPLRLADDEEVVEVEPPMTPFI